MSTELHAFTSYKIIEDEIHYENDEDYDIASGNWHYIHTIIEYGNFLLDKNISLPAYNWLDDVALAKKGMDLIEPEEFVILCESVIKNIEKLNDTENPLISQCCHLYSYEKSASFKEQKKNLLHYAEMLLNWARKGLYFVEEAIH